VTHRYSTLLPESFGFGAYDFELDWEFHPKIGDALMQDKEAARAREAESATFIVCDLCR
jgi:hypothetical protein